MSSSSSAIRFQILAFLPVLGITLFIAHSQYRALTGEVYRVAIEGYDPRDLIHGHYLRYRFFAALLTECKGSELPHRYLLL